MNGRRPQHPDREKAADLRWKGLLLGSRPCARCGGLLTRDEGLSVSMDRKLPSLRCIQCGEWIDEIILRNRVMIGLWDAANRNRLVRKDYSISTR